MKYHRLIYNHLVHRLFRLSPEYVGALRILGRRPRKIDKNGCYILKSNYGEILIRPGTSDLNVYYQIYYREEYAYSVEVYKKHFKKDPRWIIDLGANIGLATRYFSEHFNNSSYLCVEPDPDSYSILELNTAHLDNVYCEQCAIWSKNEKLLMRDDFRDGREWSRRFITSTNIDKNPAITAYTLSDIMYRHKIEHIDILKVDIEGAEKEVIFSNPAFVFLLSKIKMIIVEIHPEYCSRIEATNFFVANGFSVYTWGETSNAVNTAYISSSDTINSQCT